MYTDFHI
jgi:kinetochore protein Spc24